MKWLIRLLVVVAIGLGGFFYVKSKWDSDIEITIQTQQAHPEKQPDKKKRTIQSDQAPPKKPNLTFNPPSLKQIQMEAEEHPHETPDSVYRFAEELAVWMTQAKESEAIANDFFDELESCTFDDNLAPSTQAQCLIGAKRLSQFHQGLVDRYQHLDQDAPPSALALKRMVEQMGN